MAPKATSVSDSGKSEVARDQAQLDRFKQTARELGCDETGEPA